jgi:Kef-type K+ transport system membrane component KefB
VIARTLTDLGQLQSDVGVVVISAAVLSDLIGWVAFAAVMGMTGGPNRHALPVGWAAASTVLFSVVMLTVVRWGLVRLLPVINARWSWPGGILGFCLGLALLAGALTEWLGLHAIFGAFLAGASLAGNPHLRERTREVLNQFIGFFFAPLFFTSIGLRVDLRNDLDIGLTAVVLAIACIGKLIGGSLGARLGGMNGRDSWAVGVALNSRGVMEIILGTLALEAGLIGKPLFVALVVTALATSLFASPMLLRLIGRGPASLPRPQHRRQ